jgi:acetoin utilization deacetylase AcuC-like enzyme
MRAWHCDGREVPLPEGHRFPMGKYALLRRRLIEERVFSEAEMLASDLIEREVLFCAHEPAYVDAVFQGTLTDAELRRLGFPWSEALVARSRASAFAAEGAGFCVFNDIAVAARALQREGLIDRAVVVDLDVHQGDGTAAIFEGDPSVFTFSMHGARNFPFRKRRSSLDVELPDGCGDEEYLAALAAHLPRVLDEADAQILFFQAGVDPLEADSLGRLKLSLEGLRRRDRLVLRSARERGLPVAVTLGGGYARPVSLSVEAHLGTFREARAAVDR